MTATIIFTIASLTILGLVLALILYFTAQKFKVVEDPRIDEVETILPGANCGGCGYTG
ncbi:MAG: ferredoxin, partial [Bacteroidales bacterium]|nr:ferredoxin [Bacteroidales bacterium]